MRWSHSPCQDIGAAAALCNEASIADHGSMIPQVKPSEGPERRHFLREWREYREMSQKDLARIVAELTENESFDRTRISKFETFAEGIREEHLYVFAQALGIMPGWIFEDPEIIERERSIIDRLRKRSDKQIDALLRAVDAFDEAP